MSEKKILSHEEKSISSFEHTKNLKKLAAQLWEEIAQLQKKRVQTVELVCKTHEQYKRWINNGGNEQQAGQLWRDYKTHSDMAKYLRNLIQVKQKAWQKYNSQYQKQQEEIDC